MQKFQICATVHVEKAVQFEIEVSSRKVIATLGLEKEDAQNWEEHVADYVQQKWEEIWPEAEANSELTDSTDTGYNVESAELIE